MPLLRNQPQSNVTQTNSPLRSNSCKLVFFSNAAASAAAPASPTSLSDHGGASAATQTTHHSARPSHKKTKSSTNKTKMPLLRNQPQSNITQTNSLLRSNLCKLVFFSNAAASAAAPASPTLLPDHGGASAATQTTHTSQLHFTIHFCCRAPHTVKQSCVLPQLHQHR